MSSFKTVKKETIGLYREKGSKFYGHLFPVNSEAEFKDKLSELKEQYHDAGHHCFAIVLDGSPILYKSSDDGEPRHSAGDPMLNVLKSNNLINAGAVVVRYFGGTKLGVPGLIRAYREAVLEAIDKNSIVTQKRVVLYDIVFNYQESRRVKSLLSVSAISILSENWGTTIQFLVAIEESSEEDIINRLQQIQGIQTRRVKT